MKNLILLCLFALALTACKKSEDAAPEAGATVAGSYSMTLFGLDIGNGYNEVALPANTPPTTASGIITSVRKDANNVELSAKVTLVQSGTTVIVAYPPAPLVSIPATLQVSSTGYDMINGGTKIGTADGTTISIDIAIPASGTTKAQRYVFKGKK